MITVQTTEKQQTPLAKITTDGGTQSRAEINQGVVDDYADVLANGGDFPPVVLFFDGTTHWLADGYHRFHAYKKAGLDSIPSHVKQGSQREAILYSVGANASHGLRRTNDDKRRAVMRLLDDREWSNWSDREIARQCGVSQPFVSKIRPLTDNVISENGDVRRPHTCNQVASEDRTYTTKHGTASVMKTANIGKSQGKDDDDSPEENTLPAPLKEAFLSTRTKSDPGEKLYNGLPAADRIAELEENAAGDLAKIQELKDELALFKDIRMEFDRGGLEAVIKDLRESNQKLRSRLATESQHKAENYRMAKRWEKRALKLGYNRDLIIG